MKIKFDLSFQSIEVKKNLTLTCKVTGKPEPEVKWYCNNVEVKQTFKIKATKDKEVVSLSISGVTLQMTGDYKVVAKNSAGEAEHVAKVTVCGKKHLQLLYICVNKALNI